MMSGERPHWEADFPQELWPAFTDFRNLLAIIWSHLGLPEPTRAQYEIAHRLQCGADSRAWKDLDDDTRRELLSAPRYDIIRCFRSLGKSYITSAYVIWRLMRNPRDEKILVVSASAGKAKDFVSQTKGILQSLALCQWLLKGKRQTGAQRRDQADQFDVAHASLSQSHSVIARGITSQITGSRATLLVADDIEVERNSLTEEARARLVRSVESDFLPITKTEFGRGDIIMLGTPQTEESIYNIMVTQKGFACMCIPVRYPDADKVKNYTMRSELDGREDTILARYLTAAKDAGELDNGHPTDTRFTASELIETESRGRATFALQYMLDTSLSDAERYPLKQHDLIVFASNPTKAPLTIQWGRDNDKGNVIRDVHNRGFSGDHLLRPLFYDEDWAAYEGKTLFVDPAGRGKDETAWCVGASLSGTIYALHIDGHAGDPAEAMLKIAHDAKRFDVNIVEFEPNLGGGGMWKTAFEPVLMKVWKGGCTVQEGEWASGQKERRVIDTLEPVMTQHRLVIDEQIVRTDATSVDLKYSLLYQLTHITRERGALTHDDRLEALSGLVAHFQRSVGQDIEDARHGYEQSKWEAEIDDFIENYFEGGLVARRGKARSDYSRDEVYMTRQ